MRGMRPVRALGIYIIAVFIGGALVAPWLYWLTQVFSQWVPHLASSPFHRFVNRSLLGIALLGLWPLLRSLDAKHWDDLGLVNPKGNGPRLAFGFCAGFVSLALVAGLALASGARTLTAHPERLGQRLAGAALTAMAVAVLEEVLFRGALFGTLRQAMGWIAALIISSVIYALVHFMESAKQTGPVLWYSGLDLLPRMLRGFGDWHALVPGFFTLTLAGSWLALSYQRTGNLYFSIGLHAGWIFWLKSYGNLTHEVPGANAWVWGGGKLLDGWMALLIITLMFLCFLGPGRIKNGTGVVVAKGAEGASDKMDCDSSQRSP